MHARPDNKYKYNAKVFNKNRVITLLKLGCSHKCSTLGLTPYSLKSKGGVNLEHLPEHPNFNRVGLPQKGQKQVFDVQRNALTFIVHFTVRLIKVD